MLPVLLLLLVTQSSCVIIVQNFTFVPFRILWVAEQAMAPKLTKFKKVDVAQMDSKVKVSMSLVEYLFLKMSFNYLNTVPDADKIMFRMPDI